MDKRVSGAKQVDVIEREVKKVDLKSAEQKIEKIKEALKGVDWNYDTLFEDLNGFIEGHEASAVKLKQVESEKQKLSVELNKTEQKIQFLSKKLQDNQNELNYVKRGYQLRVDELLAIKNELQQKFEGLGNKKVHNDQKIKELSDLIKEKEAEITKYKLQIEKSEIQFSEITKSFNEKIQKFKQQMIEKSESKEKLLTAKANRISSEKDQLQKYVSELMSDNNRSNQEIQILKKNLMDSNQQKDVLLNQKNILTKKIEDNDVLIKTTQTKIGQLEGELLISNKKNHEKDLSIVNLKKQIDEQKVELSKYEANQKKLSQHLKLVNHDLLNQKDIIRNLNEEIEGYKKTISHLDSVKNSYELAKSEIAKLTTEISLINEKNIAIKKENQDLSKSIDTYKLEIQNLASKEIILNKRLTDVQEDHEKSIQNLNLQKSELQENINLISKELSEALQNLNLKNLDFVDQAKRLQDLTSDLNKYKEENSTLVVSIESAVNSKTQLESALAQAKSDLKSIKDKVVAKAVEVEDLKKSLVGYENSKVSLKTISDELSAEKKQNSTLLEKITSSLSKIESLENVNTRLNKEKEDLAINLKAIEEKSIKDLAEVNESLVNTKSILARKVNDIKSLESKISVLESNELEYTKMNDGLNHQIQLLQDEIARSEDRNVEAQDQISAFNVQKNQLELEIIDNRQKIVSMEALIEDYLLEIEGEKQKYSELKSKFSLMEQKLSLQTSSVQGILEQKQEAEDQKESFRSMAEDLKFELSEREQDLVQKQRMIDEVILERKKVASRNEELNAEVSRLTIELESKTSDFISEQKMTGDLERDLKLKTTEVFEIKSELNTSKGKIAELTDAVFELKQERDRLKSQIQELTTLCDDLKSKSRDSKEEYLAEVRSLELEIDSLKLEKQDLIDKSLDLTGAVKSKDTQIQNLLLDIKGHEAKYVELNDEIFSKQNVIAQKDEFGYELNERIKNLEFKNSDLSLKLSQTEVMYQEVVSKMKAMEQEEDFNKNLYSKVKAKSKELEIALSSIAKREEQLSLYSRWVDSQKEGIQRQVLKLASELRTTKDLNPLHPYLKMTEREISKIEVLMTKSNIFGPQRVHLESQYEQLVKQRDEVRELLSKVNLEVDQKAQALVSALKSSEFIPVPPLPPGKVEESETEVPV